MNFIYSECRSEFSLFLFFSYRTKSLCWFFEWWWLRTLTDRLWPCSSQSSDCHILYRMIKNQSRYKNCWHRKFVVRTFSVNSFISFVNSIVFVWGLLHCTRQNYLPLVDSSMKDCLSVCGNEYTEGYPMSTRFRAVVKSWEKRYTLCHLKITVTFRWF